MIITLSLVTSVKDYVEVLHKLIESDSAYQITSYNDLGALLSYLILSSKQFILNFLSFRWLQQIQSLPVLVPDIASAMLSEVSILDGYFHNLFTFLEKPISYGNQTLFFYSLEKFTIGLINSLFFFLPSSTASLISLRRFVVQGVEAGFLSGLGSLVGSLLWTASILFGWRFLVLPWLSLDLLRYSLGLILLVQYMWNSYTERRMVLEDLSKFKIFLLTFLLAFTEQSSLFPFISKISLGSDMTALETFPSSSVGDLLGSFNSQVVTHPFFGSVDFFLVHFSYLLGLGIGGLSLLHLTCWFWENPAFRLYTWTLSSLKISNRFNYKFLNFAFLYLTMICALSNILYFGLDYTLTKPLGFVSNDRVIDQKTLPELSFLSTKASDRNTRMNMGRRGRRERWKKSLQRYRNFDASLYGEGIYDLFTIEDLNYGFDRFWLRRKMRNHDVPFRLFPGPWVRSFKKELARPRLESFSGPRLEFFRILFEQVYHPSFHEKKPVKEKTNESFLPGLMSTKLTSYSNLAKTSKEDKLVQEFAILRKFVRKANKRIKISKIAFELENSTKNILPSSLSSNSANKASDYIYTSLKTEKIFYSKRWKEIFSKWNHKFITSRKQRKGMTVLGQRGSAPQALLGRVNSKNYALFKKSLDLSLSKESSKQVQARKSKREFQKQLSKKDQQILKYRAFLTDSSQMNVNSSFNLPSLANSFEKEQSSLPPFKKLYKPISLLHPIKFYLHKEKAFKRKFKFYGPNIYRNFGISNNSPYFRIMMKKFFYYYKPSLRWERTVKLASLKKIRRRGSRKPLVFHPFETGDDRNGSLAKNSTSGEINKVESSTDSTLPISFSFEGMQKPTHMFALIGKRATRYRSQIYKDVLQHWYYSPFNRFLLRLDIDAFIRRQPFSHFLKKSEEQLLNLRRALLMNYFESLRWYTYMQHYSSMKTSIGGSKSFASRFYNQQFQGTFKKVRHLFSLTPSLNQGGYSVLKWDQPLYHEYPNNENYSFLNDSILHEELLANEENFEGLAWPNKALLDKKTSLNLELNEGSLAPLKENLDRIDLETKPQSLVDQSRSILGNYLEKARPVRQNLIEKYLREKNYWELTQFLFKGQKTRGNFSTTNESLFLNQEKEYLFTKSEKEEVVQAEREKVKKLIQEGKIKEKIWVSLIKKSQNNLYDRKAFKNFLRKKVEIEEKRKGLRQKQLKTRLENIQNWFIQRRRLYSQIDSLSLSLLQDKENYQILNGSTGIQKAFKEAMEESLANKVASSSRERKLGLKKVNKSLLEKKLAKSFFRIEVLLHKKGSHLKESISKLKSLSKKSFFWVQKIFQKARFLGEKKVEESKLSLMQDEKSTLLASEKSGFVQSIFKNIKSFFISKIKIKNQFGQSGRDLKSWKRKQHVFVKRKQTRKVLKELKKQKNRINSAFSQKLLGDKSFQLLDRQKKDSSKVLDFESFKSFNQKVKSFEPWNALNFTKDFQTRASAKRGARPIFNRGAIKKPSLTDKLKRQFKILKRYGKKLDNKKIEQEIIKENPENEFSKRIPKQRRTRQRENRFWHRHKKPKYSQNRRKMKKRKQFSIGKIRKLNKELKRIKSQLKIQQWWWEKFLPNFQANIDGVLENSKNQKIKEKLQVLSPSEILNRNAQAKLSNSSKVSMEVSNQISSSESFNAQSLEIGNYDYKPLALPESLSMLMTSKEDPLSLEKDSFKRKELNPFLQSLKNKFEKNDENSLKQEDNREDYLNLNNFEAKRAHQNLEVVKILSKNLLNSNLQNNSSKLEKFKYPGSNLLPSLTSATQTSTQFSKFPKLMESVNPLPFYAGWDESLRKFVVTNRLLSRREAGYKLTANLFNLKQNAKTSFHLAKANENLQDEFTSYPLKGMNVATTLYWQIPFTTYDPDQFFALGRDGFAPIGWKSFKFRYAKESIKPILVQSKNFIDKISLEEKVSSTLLKKDSQVFKNQQKNIRFSQKRNKRIKRHPRSPLSFPSGPLVQEVLPVHYIYVFYKGQRLPRDRYLNRRLRRGKPSFAIQDSFFKLKDWTLRKRVKPRRRYHRKISLQSALSQKNILALRRQFRISENSPSLEKEEVLLQRPMSKQRLTTGQQLESRLKERYKESRKHQKIQSKTDNLRIRQLRRRVQRQVLRPVWRYRPQAGGFIWPGDYLRLEAVKLPRLKSTKDLLNEEKQLAGVQLQASSGQGQKEVGLQAIRRKLQTKKKRKLTSWQIQPKKYLVEKHNVKVLKRRLERSQNSHKLNKKIKELSALTFLKKTELI
uniref:hypothetical chloroplast RF1 n=1 Tax=Parallela transversalis TaxID=163324 RepID=UPI0010C53CED|nr:hypothetical chloroplast RF1 [Parallela transversalis]AYQ22854.1 hypothetical chloroplast RF1 [Parallela transversalis]